MKYGPDEVIEYIPKVSEGGSKLGLMGCLVQIGVMLLLWLGVLTFLVFIALLI
jgi:hypothetical protein